MNKPINLLKADLVSASGHKIQFVYERETDIADVYFGKNEVATGIELTPHLLLRVNLEEKRAISLTIRHFSILTEQTKYGPRSYRLENLESIPESPREMILSILTSDPVNQFLKVSHFQNSTTERIPFTYIETPPMKMAA